VRPLLVSVLPGPDGPVHIAVSGEGVVAVHAGGDREGFEAHLGPFDPPDDAARARWAAIRSLVEAAVRGEPVELTRIPLDTRHRSRWEAAVLRAVQGVGWGETASYGEIAARAGSPRASRAAGAVVARCDLDDVVPCHRIIAADGTLGGYGGAGAADRDEALERKRTLLLREGRTVPRRRR
jgi:methylated-DNA-[protein]-cysteine S-methyltransferase